MNRSRLGTDPFYDPANEARASWTTPPGLWEQVLGVGDRRNLRGDLVNVERTVSGSRKGETCEYECGSSRPRGRR
ncbi:MAG: hypothetical protein H0W82_10045 [Actinobacteria bacterium]|nr:hypothetical protein [Actinomycetota bacterium]